MAEKKIDECVNTVDDHDLEKVAGGGLFSKYSVAEYEAAGVTVINPGYLYNEKYKLTNSGEDLVLASGVNSHSASGENNQSQTTGNDQCISALI